LAINGDNGHGDYCDFYMDMWRARHADTSFKCRSYITPKGKPKFEGVEDCNDVAKLYSKIAERPSKAKLKEKILKMVRDNPNEAHFIMFTDHGTKEIDDKNTFGESKVSIGEDDLTESELKEIITAARKEQEKAACEKFKEIGKKCDFKAPALMFAFDHCYSGGMLNSLFKEGNPGQNLCGVSSAQHDELAFTGDTFMKSLNILKLGLLKKNKYLV